jgi:autoinducer 2-degrading protein
MIVTSVYVHVKADKIDDFIKASRNNHEGSVLEPGNLRFDFLQETEDPTRFMIYEAYESAEAAMAHKGTSHYMAWRDTVADWMIEPRKGITYQIVVPNDKNAW